MKHFLAPAGLALLVVTTNLSAADGKAVYTQICRACHATGVAGAPILGDKSAWAPRLPAGLEALQQSALRGKGGMPPKGGQPGTCRQPGTSCGGIYGVTVPVGTAPGPELENRLPRFGKPRNHTSDNC
ncbi:c-type cytochrome [Aromatoleum toluolicum]|uniref:c-type cytochrome n=1 Tax=Aromatoleum toluolicum TaxID=90060 RepID=UPI001B7CF65C